MEDKVIDAIQRCVDDYLANPDRLVRLTSAIKCYTGRQVQDDELTAVIYKLGWFVVEIEVIDTRMGYLVHRTDVCNQSEIDDLVSFFSTPFNKFLVGSCTISLPHERI